MSTPTPPHHADSATEYPLTPATALLFDRAPLEGLECRDSGWDEWDACVAEADLLAALAHLLH